MKTSVKDGLTKTIAAPSGGVTAGHIVLVGDIVGVALSTVAATLPVVLETVPNQVYTFPKATGEAWTDGAKLYWDATNKKLTTTASGNTLVAAADAAAASGDTTGNARVRQFIG